MNNPSKVIANLWPQSLVTIVKLIACAWIVGLAVSAGIIGSFWGLLLFCALVLPSAPFLAQWSVPLINVEIDKPNNDRVFHEWKSTTDEEPDFVPIVQPA